MADRQGVADKRHGVDQSVCDHQWPEPTGPAPGVSEYQAHHHVTQAGTEALVEVVGTSQDTRRQHRLARCHPELAQAGDQIPHHDHLFGESVGERRQHEYRDPPPRTVQGRRLHLGIQAHCAGGEIEQKARNPNERRQAHPAQKVGAPT